MSFLSKALVSLEQRLTRAYKIAVVALSYALGGLAGALYAPFAGFAHTELLFWLLSGQVLIMVIVGGAGTLIGPMLVVRI